MPKPIKSQFLSIRFNPEALREIRQEIPSRQLPGLIRDLLDRHLEKQKSPVA